MKASVVIGSSFGDEGKGLVTNWLSDKDTTVIRFNGGAQAGHTVELENGDRTVFSHIGAGTWQGAQTYLSEDFVINPIIFRKEFEALEPKLSNQGIFPSIYWDYRCKFTTPWDIILNQELEQTRGDDKHGSVGLGFGETIERYEQLGLRTSIEHIYQNKKGFADFMIDKWVPARAKDLGIESRIQFMLPNVSSDNFIDRYFEDIRFFLDNTMSMERQDPTKVVSFVSGKRSSKIVCEGAQGLLLDQNFGTFPHVTRSNTGLANIDRLAKLNHLTSLDVYYTTRCYLTRHGAGPLNSELNEPPVEYFSDKTNKPNPFQGKLRFAPLDLNKLRKRIELDLKLSHLPKNLNLVVTCMDQIGEDNKVPVIIDGSIKELKDYELMGELMCFFPEFNLKICSDPTGKSIRDWFI